jgi:hypothetical protein
MEARYGAVRLDGSHKPLFDAFRTFATRGDVLPASEECGDFTAPELTVEHPTEGGQFASSLPLKASATDAGGMARISFFVNSRQKAIRNYWDKATPPSLAHTMDWQGAKELPLGRHTIIVRAVDVAGNQTERSITVTKVKPSEYRGIPTTLQLKLSGKGAKKKLRVRVVGETEALSRVLGKVSVVWQKKVGRKWRTAHKWTSGAKNADTKPVRFRQKLKKARRWRVRAVYVPSPGTAYARSKSKFLVFKF